MTLPAAARVIIGGGGVVGTSVAYHLARLGVRDVLLLEQAKLSAGTTWHAAGLIGKLRANPTGVKLSDYASKLLPELEEETGMATGWRQCGSINIARTPGRVTALRRSMAMAHGFGIEARIMPLDEVKERYPIMNTDDVLEAMWMPEDATANATDICMAFAKGAKMHGATIKEGVAIDTVNTEEGRVKSVTTECGSTIECDTFVNCGGMWARQLGLKSEPSVSVPLHAAEHFYLVTKPMEGVYPMLPILRDPDSYMYYREWSGGLICGGFEPVGHVKPCFHDGVPRDFEFSLFEEDWEHIGWAMDDIFKRIPAVETTEIRQLLNGPESFTADNQYILGEAPEVRNYFVAAGMNSSGIASSAGAGKALSEWIHNGKPTMDLWTVDIRRLAAFQNNNRFLRDRCAETLGLHYALQYPHSELASCRGIRRSPLFAELEAAGAEFGSKLGWERPNYFVTEQLPGPIQSFGVDGEVPGWYHAVRKEHESCRSDAAVFDMSSFGKFLVQGPDALQTLQRLCANNVDQSSGKVIYTAMLNEQGGFESDCTVTRLDDREFLVVSGTAQATRDLHWMRSNLGSDTTVITDVTSSWGVLSLMGPKAPEILAEWNSLASLQASEFPFSTARWIDVGYAKVLASRVSYVGECGWELYIPTESVCHVYESLKEAKQSWVNAGYYTINSLRLEKGFKAWGADIGPDVTPLAAGLDFAVDFRKDFIGKAALEAAKQLASDAGGLTNRIVSVHVTGPQPNAMWGGEQVLRDGKTVGFVTSSAHSFELDAPVGFATVTDTVPITEEYLSTGHFTVAISGRESEARLTFKPPVESRARK